MHPKPNYSTLSVLPKRIIIMRHGESRGNLDYSAYSTIPDHQIPLTDVGLAQAQDAGARLRHLISTASSTDSWRVHFYVSPYARAQSTLRELGRSFTKKRIIGVREECRIREQDFGNFQVEERMRAIKRTRERFGRFFYRFPEGESAADVFDRVSSTSSVFFLLLLFCMYACLPTNVKIKNITLTHDIRLKSHVQLTQMMITPLNQRWASLPQFPKANPISISPSPTGHP